MFRAGSLVTLWNRKFEAFFYSAAKVFGPYRARAWDNLLSGLC